jgi:hypothetical protein
VERQYVTDDLVPLIDEALQTGVRFAELASEQARRGLYVRSRRNLHVAWTVWEAASRLFTIARFVDDAEAISSDHREVIRIAIDGLGKTLAATKAKLTEAAAEENGIVQ